MGNYKGYTKTVSTSDFTDTPRFVLEQPTGSVQVEGWDRAEIEVSISDERELFTVEVDNNQVSVRHLSPQNSDLQGMFETYRNELGDLGELGANLSRVAAKVERQVERQLRRVERGVKGVYFDFGRWTGGRDYTVRVPHNCDLSLRSSSGDLTVTEVNGSHYLQSNSGDINIDALEGTVVFSTNSGDLTAAAMNGKLGARTASGEISISESSLSALSITTASGDISLELISTPEREFQIKTVSGDVDITIPGDAKLSVDVNTLSGDISTSFPGAEAPSRRRGPGRSGTIELNGGGLRSIIHTVSGDITIDPDSKSDTPEKDERMGQHTVDLSRAFSQPGDSDKTELDAARKREAEMSILSSLQNGDIDIDEAMRQLSQL